MSKFVIIFMVFIPFQVISLKMMSGDDRYQSPWHPRLDHGEGLFALKDSCFCIPMIHGALDITVFTARGKMPREVKGQHVAQIPAVL